MLNMDEDKTFTTLPKPFRIDKPLFPLVFRVCCSLLNRKHPITRNNKRYIKVYIYVHCQLTNDRENTIFDTNINHTTKKSETIFK